MTSREHGWRGEPTYAERGTRPSQQRRGPSARRAPPPARGHPPPRPDRPEHPTPPAASGIAPASRPTAGEPVRGVVGEPWRSVSGRRRRHPLGARDNGADLCRFSAKVSALHTASHGAATPSEGRWKRPFAWPILTRRPGLAAALHCPRPRLPRDRGRAACGAIRPRRSMPR